MLVRMTTTMAGPAGCVMPGAVIDLPDAQARQLLDGGYAVPVMQPAPARQVESAVVEPPRNAMARRRGK